MTIRTWLERDTESTAAETLEISRLRRENEALLKIRGQLTCRAELREKISAVAVTNKSALARELGVSRSSLYYRPKKPDKDEALRREIERVMLKHPAYGSPRVGIALKINEKRAARVMRKYGLRPARHAKTPYKPADQGRESLDYPCIFSQLSPAAPDVVWASDFTFICYRCAFVYLCTVIDVFTGEVLGFNISRTCTASAGNEHQRIFITYNPHGHSVNV